MNLVVEEKYSRLLGRQRTDALKAYAKHEYTLDDVLSGVSQRQIKSLAGVSLI